MSTPEDYYSDEWTDTDSEINSDDLTDICSGDGSDAGPDAGSDNDSDAGSELDRDVFGPLVDISEESIIALATRIARDVLHVLPGKAELLKTVSGSYNIVHIVQLETVKLVIRIPATGWGDGMTKVAEDALSSQVATMRFIKEQTGAPVPEVYSWDPTNNNEISAPFICMSFVTGETVSSVWFKDSMDDEAREQFRLNILTSIAAIMAKFSSMTFDKMGSLMQAEDGSFFLGPMFEWVENDDDSVHAKATRTYFSMDELLACSIESGPTGNVHIAEAIAIAALNSLNRLEICCKFVQVALGLDKDDAISVILDIGEDEYDKRKWNVLKDKLKALVCPPATPSREA
ncbi:Altered inheritance of mitochondria protein 9, mitochondrial [Fusarium oxysporum f. sp. cubense race 1]|uniref:Altered inheritance of mitochondria protein 9, mitochondrial n=1 Tax=Fusarium oxysporum f. sp. cubense (strain race 1) TaxID=1229664 RepID=N4U7D9_FUSC1|nr:Altered inheritance of mitochondria protein 9, mitochondrial [Fusarium oxysporum f. sp. cubense race 1]